jgi:hypothetical protein
MVVIMADLPKSDQISGLLSKFTNEEQDPAVIEQAHSKLSETLTAGEEIHYIAVQKILLMNVSGPHMGHAPADRAAIMGGAATTSPRIL